MPHVQRKIEGDEKSYLETGDLGFIHEGQLYICGRLKDLIIIHGKNHYPQDIEYACHSLPQIKQGSIAAFTVLLQHMYKPQVVDKEEEQLIVVTETRECTDDLDSLFKSMKNRISEENGITPSVIVVVKPKTIPKTTSGKISRSAVKQQYMQDELDVIAKVSYKPEEVNEQEIRSTFGSGL